MKSTDILKEHYKNWADTTQNPVHRRYAEDMYNAVLNGTHKEALREYGGYTSMLIEPSSGRIFNSIQEAADAFGVKYHTMQINYIRYGLKKIKK
jgi:hypothetical protein